MPATKIHLACTIHEEGNVTTSIWLNIKKKVTYAKISPKMVNLRDIAGERRRRTHGLLASNLKLGTLIYACVFYFCICTCSAQLSMFHMKKRSRNTLIIIIIIIISIIIIIIIITPLATRSYAWGHGISSRTA